MFKVKQNESDDMKSTTIKYAHKRSKQNVVNQNVVKYIKCRLKPT